MTTANHQSPLRDLASSAKGALERVCSGAGLDPASRYYGPDFVDHVNDLEFHGLEGTQQSVDLYKAALDDITVSVEEQVVQGPKVVSRFVVTGSSYGRRVRFRGITISRFENGLIIEDWSVTDTLGMLRQLGVWRSVAIGIRQWRTLKQASSRASRDRSYSQRSSALRST
jgi:predicted ester cyclase